MNSQTKRRFVVCGALLTSDSNRRDYHSNPSTVGQAVATRKQWQSIGLLCEIREVIVKQGRDERGLPWTQKVEIVPAQSTIQRLLDEEKKRLTRV